MVELHEPVSERIGKILRENREAQGLTRQQLSEKSTVSDRQISAIELGEKNCFCAVSVFLPIRYFIQN